MCRSAIYLTFFIIFVISLVLIVHNNKTFINYIGKINNETYNLRNCCTSGSYDNETNSCIGPNNKKHPFALQCQELVSLDGVELEDTNPAGVIK